ncbi:MAG: hypothetical protein ACUZ8H_14880 [Candidatus Anammoxibacter sp.]
MRLRIEEEFKTIKTASEVESFTGRKYEYQINRTSALFYLKEKIVSLFTLSSFNKTLKCIKAKVVENILPIRPGIKFERKFPIAKTKKYSYNRRVLV